MRSLFAGMMMLSASMAVVGAAQAQIQSQRPPGYGSMQAPIGHRQPTQYDLQPSQDDRTKIDKDNQQFDLPASQDNINGAGQLHSNEDALTNRIGRDNSTLDREITDICPSCGGAEDAALHQRSRPIQHGFNHQPIMSSSDHIHGRRPARAP
jgi:hypothetical protein